MNRSIFRRYVWPFLQWFALMIFIAIVVDYFFHLYEITSVGRYLGYVGTGIIVASFVYSLRKRKIIGWGSPKKLLTLHEYMAWGGSVLILVHAGIHFNALLPWLAVLLLLIAVASGLTGKFLLKRAAQTLKEKQAVLVKSGMTKEEVEKKLFYDSIMVDAMKKWRAVHLPITFLLALLVLIHIVSEFLFSA